MDIRSQKSSKYSQQTLRCLQQRSSSLRDHRSTSSSHSILLNFFLLWILLFNKLFNDKKSSRSRRKSWWWRCESLTQLHIISSFIWRFRQAKQLDCKAGIITITSSSSSFWSSSSSDQYTSSSSCSHGNRDSSIWFPTSKDIIFLQMSH